jgi:hypothetical protein
MADNKIRGGKGGKVKGTDKARATPKAAPTAAPSETVIAQVAEEFEAAEVPQAKVLSEDERVALAQAMRAGQFDHATLAIMENFRLAMNRAVEWHQARMARDGLYAERFSRGMSRIAGAADRTRPMLNRAERKASENLAKALEVLSKLG